MITSTLSNFQSITKTLLILQGNEKAQVDFLSNVEKSLGLDTIIMLDVEGIEL